MVDFSLLRKLIPEIDIYWKSQTARVTAGTTKKFQSSILTSKNACNRSNHSKHTNSAALVPPCTKDPLQTLTESDFTDPWLVFTPTLDHLICNMHPQSTVLA